MATAQTSYDPQTLVIGVLGRPHGTSGELFLHTHNGRGTDLADISTLILDRDGVREPRRLLEARRTADGWLVCLEGVSSREVAATLTHARVRLPREVLPRLAEGEFFVEDILGCAVRHENGADLGVVEGTFWNGAHDVMVVAGAREQLIPLVPDFVRSVDAVGRLVVVAWDQVD